MRLWPDGCGVGGAGRLASCVPEPGSIPGVPGSRGCSRDNRDFVRNHTPPRSLLLLYPLVIGLPAFYLLGEILR